ncbi:MAG: family 43 glycosylhydrolase [Kiritimatiellaeota bacterium]|nr:family 43 glycosylhydrolase [Kiritimatiellota bacterium]
MKKSILNGVSAADPTLKLFGGRYYIYPTDGGVSEQGFCAWSSDDLRVWRPEGMALALRDVAWAKGDAWAPDIVARNGIYYFYFCTGSAIGVATATTPIGSFKDALGRPLIPYESDMSSIDPMAFIDDDGQAWLYWGATFDGRLFVRKLNPDMISFAGEKSLSFDYKPDAYYHCEGSFMFKRDGRYYFMWSEYNWASNPRLDDDPSYRVNFAVADSPAGPFKRIPARLPLLSTDMARGFVGPGHNSVLRLPDTGEHLIAYHWHSGDAVRHVAIDVLKFGADGLPWTVNPSPRGVPARPVRASFALRKTGAFRFGETIVFETRASDALEMSLLDTRSSLPLWQGAHNDTIEIENLPRGFYRVALVARLRGGKRAVFAPLDFDVV